jgi:hypothetical protein
VTIAGRDTPGVATVTGLDRERKWDHKEGPGASGETSTFRGKRNVEPVVKIKLFETEAYDEYLSLMDYLETFADSGKAVDFWHPSAEAAKCRSVTITSLGPPVAIKEGDALFEATIKLREYSPPPKTNATKSPNGSKQGTAKGGSGAAQPPALTEAEREAARLLEEARRIQ